MPRAAHRQAGAIIHLSNDIKNDAVIRTKNINKQTNKKKSDARSSRLFAIDVCDRRPREEGNMRERKLEPLSEGGMFIKQQQLILFFYVFEANFRGQ